MKKSLIEINILILKVSIMFKSKKELVLIQKLKVFN